MEVKPKARRGRPPKNNQKTEAHKTCDVRVNHLYQLDLTDTKIERDAHGKAKALVIEMEISASGKVTNGRIYPPKGHQAGIDSWTVPYGKVVLRHHDDLSEPIGRYSGAVWVDNEAACLDFLNGDYKALASIKRSFDSGDAKAVYKTMKQYDALGKKWPGLGKVIGTVRILDEDAIEKFLDGRYLTWSAGQTTDSLVCMMCNSDWRKGEFCDHQMGGVDDNGDPVVFLCGTMYGEEGSVVNKPANDTSVTLSMKFEDSARDDINMSLTLSDQLDTAPIVVPTVSVEKIMNLTDLQALEITTVLSLLKDDAKILEFVDALKGDDHFEVNWLIRIHDALHDQWDYQLKYADPNAPPRMPMSVYKLHGAIHDLSVEKDFRDAMMNGVLDGYDSEGAPSDEYMVYLPSVEDATAGKSLVLTDEQLGALAAQIRQVFEQEKQEAANVVETPSQEEEVQKEDQQVEGEVLNAEEPAPVQSESTAPGSNDTSNVTQPETNGDGVSTTGVEELSQERADSAPAETPADSSVSPEGSDTTTAQVPVEPVVPGIDWVAFGTAFGDFVNQKVVATQTNVKYDELQADYTIALTQVQDLKEKLTSALKALRIKLEPTSDNKNVKLDALQEWFVTLNAQVTPPAISTPKLKPTSNPGQDQIRDHSVTRTKTNNQVVSTGVSKFETSAVEKYKKIRDSKGLEEATKFINSVAEYLPKTFDIKQFV